MGHRGYFEPAVVAPDQGPVCRDFRRALLYNPRHYPSRHDGTTKHLRGFEHAEVCVARLGGSVRRLESPQGCY